MVKRKSNVQNIVIIVLSILLLVSLGFGVTYSYYNGRTNLVKGTITTANLSIELHDKFGVTTEFSISAPFGEEFLVPGNNLNNVELNLYNKCNQETYMVVVYSLSAIKNDETKQDVTPQLGNTPAIAFRKNAINTNIWQPISYQCNNINATYTCLVGINPFSSKGATNGNYINVLPVNSISIPVEWNDILQNCNVTISVMAYAIQADLDSAPMYQQPILNAEEKINTTQNVEQKEAAKQEKAQAIAKAVLEICKVDYAE